MNPPTKNLSGCNVIWLLKPSSPDPWFRLWRPVAACFLQAQLLMECKAGRVEIFSLQTGIHV